MAHMKLDAATFADIAALDLEGHPFLHEQGQVVLRGFVHALDITQKKWSLCGHNIELLQKYAGIWSCENGPETYSGPINLTSFYRCWIEQRPEFGVTVQISCYGSLFHIGARLEDPWRDNLWPELDTDYLPSDMAAAAYGR